MKKRIMVLAAALVLSLMAVPSALAANTTGTAYAATQNVEVDGKAVEFQMYGVLEANGYGTNYVKLRDVAHVLSGTPAQFEVGYDGGISITTGTAYTNTGTEMTTPFSGDRAYTGGAQSLKINGKETSLDAIALMDDQGGGYTYFKLRDLGSALGFTVDWDSQRGVITVKTGSTTTPTTPTVTYYKEYPDVPDFGAYLGIPCTDVTVSSENDRYTKAVSYAYELADMEKCEDLEGKIAGWAAILEQNGYPYDGEYIDDNGNTVAVYAKGDREVQICVEAADAHPYFAVYVFDWKPDPVAGTVSFYEEHPDVPDFGAYYGVPRYDTFVDSNGTSYSKAVVYFYDIDRVGALIEAGTDVVEGYCTLLEKNGYYYSTGFEDDAGYTVIVHQKGSKAVMIGLRDMLGKSFFTVNVVEE